MENDRWHPEARFTPTNSDMFYVRPGCYAMKDKVSLILHWRQQAEEIALNAILLMMVDQNDKRRTAK